MSPRKRRKKQIDEGPFLFSEEEMLGMIENVTIIQTSEPPKETKPSEHSEVPPTSESLTEVPSASELCEEPGLNKMYSIPVILRKQRNRW